MGHSFKVSDMAYEVLDLVRSETDLLFDNNRLPGYDALDRIAGPLTCLKYGHPDQPQWFLRRFKDRPWRCPRCRTWWVTKYYPDPEAGWCWVWTRVDRELG